MKILSFIVPLILTLMLILHAASAYELSVEGGKLYVKILTGGKEYSEGPVQAKIIEGDTLEVDIDYESTQNRIGLKLEESNQGFFELVSGDPLNSFRNYTGPTNGKQSTKWGLKTTGLKDSAILKIYFDFVITTGSANVGLLTLKPVQPTKIVSTLPDKLEPGYSGNFTIKADVLPKETILEFLSGSTEDTNITTKHLEYIKPDTAIFSININKDIPFGSRSIRLRTPSGLSYLFSNRIDAVGKGSEKIDLKLSYEVLSSDKSITFYTDAPGFSGKPKLSVTTDLTKSVYELEPMPAKSGAFFLKMPYEGLGIREGIPFSYTVTAGVNVKIDTGIILGPSATATPLPPKETEKQSSSEKLENLKITEQAKTIFKSLFSGLKSVGVKI